MLAPVSSRRSGSTRNWQTYGGCTMPRSKQHRMANNITDKSSEVLSACVFCLVWSDNNSTRCRIERLPEEEIRLQGTYAAAQPHPSLLTVAALVHIHSRLERRFRTSRSSQSCLGDQILGKTDRLSRRHPILTRRTRTPTPGCQQY